MAEWRVMEGIAAFVLGVFVAAIVATTLFPMMLDVWSVVARVVQSIK